MLQVQQSLLPPSVVDNLSRAGVEEMLGHLPGKLIVLELSELAVCLQVCFGLLGVMSNLRQSMKERKDHVDRQVPSPAKTHKSGARAAAAGNSQSGCEQGGLPGGGRITQPLHQPGFKKAGNQPRRSEAAPPKEL